MGGTSDPYSDGAYRWWHLSAPSPELVAAVEDGWIPEGATVVDLGCGLGTEAAYLAALGMRVAAVDLSFEAVRRAAAMGSAACFVVGDVLALPVVSSSVDVLVDRGCFHYLATSQQPSYAQEAARVLRPGGRMLLRACMTSQGVPNGVNPAVVEAAFRDWLITDVRVSALASDTREMPAVVARLVH